MLMTTLTALTMMMVVIKSGDNLVTRIYVMMTLKWIMPMVVTMPTMTTAVVMTVALIATRTTTNTIDVVSFALC